jgi:hypothetical protein
MSYGSTIFRFVNPSSNPDSPIYPRVMGQPPHIPDKEPFRYVTKLNDNQIRRIAEPGFSNTEVAPTINPLVFSFPVPRTGDWQVPGRE